MDILCVVGMRMGKKNGIYASLLSRAVHVPEIIFAVNAFDSRKKTKFEEVG